ncbi:DUF4249 domain-containing protein [Muricauda sp. SCSIO 64092]|uniref:DUF4249 domain-containing protein n=1 Tax=Allomuricauda sp. SCSIO 64092 TaxID=2908842 RepID=UPI001FF5B7C9|nr:DUF4249 domain-containing protein [Muricauda sp. SCSIO 64092]UOY06424.1 DUF4249 domain-containing protein [Muricauda sp. SCSIO 64092]
MNSIKGYIQSIRSQNSSLQVSRSIAGCIEKRILELQTLFSIRFPWLRLRSARQENTRTDGLFSAMAFKVLGGIFLLVIQAACTDVVDVEVQNGPERLVVEASLDWEKGTPGNVQTIRLRKSTPFFDTSTTTDVTGASVVVTNDTNGTRFVFADQNNGTYQTTTFEPILGQSYSLRIEHEGEVYTARETMTPVTEITNVFQDREEGFDDEALEVHIVFTDPPEEGNNYLFRFQRRGDLLPDLEVAEDEFVNGREIDWWYEIDDDDDDLLPFEPGDVVDIEMYGISTPYYDYIKILVDQLGGQGLFETTPVAVKGNCINETNSENYPFGYFRLTEVVKTSYTFVEDE